MRMVMGASTEEKAVVVRVGSVALPGNLGIPAGAAGIVVFAHGSGSSRLSPRNRFVAEVRRTCSRSRARLRRWRGWREAGSRSTWREKGKARREREEEGNQSEGRLVPEASERRVSCDT
jgi:hypothetical protein